jgi:hypothetical protein
MFRVGEDKEIKERKIRTYLAIEPMIAVLLAAANFEWTVGRCILFMSPSPNVEIRQRLMKCSGLGRYADLWKKELVRHDASMPLLTRIVRHWGRFNDAFQLRHKLIHGRDTCTHKMATGPVETMLSATSDLYEYSRIRNVDLHSRLPIRRRSRAPR